MAFFMKIKNTFWIRFTICFFLGAPSYLFFAIIRDFDISTITDYAYVQYSGFVTMAFILLFEGHNYKSRRLEKSMAWRDNFRKRLLTEFGIALIYPIPIVLGFYSFLYLIIWKMGLYLPSIVMYCAFVIFISVIFMGFVNINYIIEDWRGSLLKNENLEKENIRAKLEALQTQLSPHFLFNNLNIIDALIEKDPELSQKYVQGLSKVFRYILDNKNRELVTLQHELAFIKEFMFLMETRFDKNVSININLKGDTLKRLVPPVSLQLIIENAIKHNEISSRNKLEINIDETIDAYLSISNNIKLRKGQSAGTGTGLKNIAERYRYLTNKEVKVNKDDQRFQIMIPMLQIANQKS